MHFNSNMVRLKAFSFELCAIKCVYFNSNMVRLKVRKVKATDTDHAKFQFQYGSIKSKLVDIFKIEEK